MRKASRTRFQLSPSLTECERGAEWPGSGGPLPPACFGPSPGRTDERRSPWSIIRGQKRRINFVLFPASRSVSPPLPLAMQQRPPAYGGYPVNEGKLNNGLEHAPLPPKAEVGPPMSAAPTMPPAGGPPPRPMPMAATTTTTGYANGTHGQHNAYGQPPLRPPPTQATMAMADAHPRPMYPGPVSTSPPSAMAHPPSASVASVVYPQPPYYPPPAQVHSSAPAGATPMETPSRPMPQPYPAAPMAAPVPVPAPPSSPPRPVSLVQQLPPMPPQPQHYAPQVAVRPSAPNVSAHHPRLSGTASMLPPTGIERLTGQMQNLSTAPTGTGTGATSVAAMAGTSMVSPGGASSQSQPVGIIGQPLPVDDLLRAPVSPIQPFLDPAYTRITLNKIPRTAAVLYKTKLPLAITVNPYAVAPERGGGDEGTRNIPPLIDGPIVRCRRCRTYLNPYVQLLDQGMKWKCNLCFLDNECTNYRIS